MDSSEKRPFAAARKLILQDRDAGLTQIRAEREAAESQEELMAAGLCQFAAGMLDADLLGAASSNANLALKAALVESDGTAECRARLLLATCLWRQRHLTEAREGLVEARKTLPRGDALLESKLEETEGLVLKGLGEYALSAACLTRARNLLAPQRNVIEWARVSINLISVLINLGDVRAALAEGLAVRRSLVGSQDLRMQYVLAYNLTVAQMRVRDYEAAWEEVERALDLQKRSGVQLEAAGLLAVRVQILCKLGRGDEALEVAKMLMGLGDEDFGPLMRLKHLSLVGECLHKLGQFEAAERCFVRSLEQSDAEEDSLFVLEARLAQLQLWLDLGRHGDVADGLIELEQSGTPKFNEEAGEDLGIKARFFALRAKSAAACGEYEVAYRLQIDASEAYRALGTLHSQQQAQSLQVLHESFRERAVQEALLKSNQELAERVRSQTQNLERAQRLEALGRLAGGVAHDFNNLLTVIGGSIELLGLGIDDSPVARPLIDESLSAVRRGGRLARRLLAFGRQIDLTMASRRADGLLENTLFLLGRLIGEKIELVSHVEIDVEESDCEVMVDEAQFDAVMMNLSLNARDAMGNGGMLTFTTRRVRGQIQIDIADSGTGIDQRVFDSLFEPFSTTKKDGEGTGLGLASSQGIVESMGGSLDLIETSPMGSLFRLTLPISETAVQQPQTIEPHPSIELRGKHCLVVEDDEAVRGVLASFLRYLGLHVSEAVDGLDAFGQMEGNGVPGIDPDFLVCDVSMPRCTGPELLVRLREVGLQQPVLFVSGWHGRYLNELHSENKSVAFLEKPIEIGALATSLRSLLDGDLAQPVR